jgi:LysM repeat protein
MENNDTNDSFYRDEIDDMGAGDYPLEDPMTFWNAEKKTLWKKVFGRSETPFILMGVALVALVIVFFAVYPGSEEPTAPSGDTAVSDRLQQIEKKLGDLQLQIEQFSQVQSELVALKASVAKIGSEDLSGSSKMEQITGELASLKAEMAEVKAGVSTAAKALVASPQTEKKEPGTQAAQAVYHEVEKGNTLYSISRQYGVSVDEIRKQNGLSAQDVIVPGQKLKIK